MAVLLLALAAGAPPLAAAVGLKAEPGAAQPGARAVYRLALTGGEAAAPPVWRASLTRLGVEHPVPAADLALWLRQETPDRWTLTVPERAQGRLSLTASVAGETTRPLVVDLAPLRLDTLPRVLADQNLTWMPRERSALNKAWNRSSKPKVRTVTIGGLVDAATLRTYFADRPGITDLRLRALPAIAPEHLAEALAPLRTLQVLIVEAECAPFQGRHLTQLAEANRSLRSLSVPQDRLTAEALAAWGSSLTHLHIEAPLGHLRSPETADQIDRACEALRHCHRLEELQSWFKGRPDTHLRDAHLPPGLRRLRVRNNSALEGLSLPPALEELTLDRCIGLRGELSAPAAGLPRLREVNITLNPFGDGRHLASILLASPALETVVCTEPLSQAALAHLRNAPLRRLSMPRMGEWDFSGFRGLARLDLGGPCQGPRLLLPPSLTHFSADGLRIQEKELPDGLKDLTLFRVWPGVLETSLPRGLENLHLQSITTWDGSGLPASLRTLSLDRCEDLTRLDHLKALETLHLTECRTLFKAGLEPLAALGPTLRELVLVDCEAGLLDERQVLALVSRLPGLRKLTLESRHPQAGLSPLPEGALRDHPSLAEVEFIAMNAALGWPRRTWTRPAGLPDPSEASSSTSSTVADPGGLPDYVWNRLLPSSPAPAPKRFRFGAGDAPASLP